MCIFVDTKSIYFFVLGLYWKVHMYVLLSNLLYVLIQKSRIIVQAPAHYKDTEVRQLKDKPCVKVIGSLMHVIMKLE